MGGDGGCARCGKPVSSAVRQYSDEPGDYDPGLERLWVAILKKRVEMGLDPPPRRPRAVTGENVARRS